MYQYEELMDMLFSYEKKYGRKPDFIALGKTHLDDLETHVGAMHFKGIEVIEHNDPIGILFVHRN